MKYRLTFLILFAFLTSQMILCQSPSWKLEGGLTISHFQQQVKADVGDVQGERLVNEFELGFVVTGMYQINEYLSAGIFLRYDTGNRHAATFDGFDAQGKTRVKNDIGGHYNEFWAGPFVRGSISHFFLDLGYGAIGIRNDNARDDLPTSTGSTEESFSTHPTIAWMLGLGGSFPVADNLDVLLKLEYRVRYYNKRGGEDIIDGVKHGTQSLAPILGIAWRL